MKHPPAGARGGSRSIYDADTHRIANFGLYTSWMLYTGLSVEFLHFSFGSDRIALRCGFWPSLYLLR